MTDVRLLHGAAEMLAAERLLSHVWHTTSIVLDAGTMQAFSHTGNYVAGVFAAAATADPDDRSDEDEQLIGCAVGFFAAPDQRSLHSHIAGVDPRFAGSGIGAALKTHQRSWCLAQGVTVITWTFDPAIARNAFFNLAKLGVAPVSYLEDFYGTLDDGLNAGSPSDRLLVRWDLADPLASGPDAPRPVVPASAAAAPYALRVDAQGGPVLEPVDRDTRAVLVQVPSDIEQLRRTHPELAAAWRFALRQVLSPYVNGTEWRVTAFVKQGCYVVERSG